MNKWPKPVSDEALTRQRAYLVDKLGSKAVENFSNLFKKNTDDVKSAVTRHASRESPGPQRRSKPAA